MQRSRLFSAPGQVLLLLLLLRRWRLGCLLSKVWLLSRHLRLQPHP